MTIPFDPSTLTPDWLTGRLRESGALQSGQVTTVDVLRQEATTTASAVRFTATYSDDASGHLPFQFFLKLSERAPEAWFYRHMAPDMKAISGILPCYAVVDMGAGGPGSVWLLFEDMTGTHAEAEPGIPMPLELIEARVDLIADVQAHWWEHPRLHSDIGQNADDVRGFIRGVTRNHLPIFLKAAADALTPAWRARLEKLMAALPLPEWTARVNARRQVTIIHGDTHEFNFLYPRNNSGGLYLIDWAVWHINTGPTDIAYFMPSRLDAAGRKNLLRRYHERLLVKGVQGYDWDTCLLDYRRAVLEGFVWPIWAHYINLNPEIWQGGIIAGMTFADGLNCDELLPG